MRYLFLSAALFLTAVLLHAQQENSNWMLGTYLGMKFNTGTMSPHPVLTSKMYAPRGTATMSDPVTGDLLFYTNGRRVYNRQHQVMANGNGITPVDMEANDVLIVPNPGNARKYYIFSVLNNSPSTSYPDCNLFFASVDMSLNGGLGDVEFKSTRLANNMDHYLCAVRQLYGNGYWLITHKKGTADFYVYSVDQDSVNRVSPRISKMGSAPTNANAQWKYGKLFSDSTGTRLFHFYQASDGQARAEMCEFDKKCGTVSDPGAFFPEISQYDQDYAYGTLSPNQRFVYISFSSPSGNGLATLYQYDLEATPNINGSRVRIDALDRAPGDVQAAPDGKIYMTMADNGNATAFLSVVNRPNEKGAACDFVNSGADLAPGFPSPTYYTEYLPNFITDRSKPGPGFEKPSPSVKSYCLGDSTQFKVNNTFTADSFYWDFGDKNRSSKTEGSHMYQAEGKYTACFHWFLCGIAYKTCIEIDIRKRPQVNLGPDTTLCPGVLLTLDGGEADNYAWSTGETTRTIQVNKQGKYKVESGTGQCMVTDEINVQYHPDIWTLLGDEYFICDKEKEMVKLDAGKGFQNYKWIPTGDTTQWIIVSDLGSYFVILKDFRGCSSSDSTTVKQRCPVSVFLPNAFTPNGDGINDVFTASGAGVIGFSLEVYNRWGEKVFSSNDINTGWDGSYGGKPAAAGAYYCVCTYSGYRKKALRTFQEKGTLTLMR